MTISIITLFPEMFSGVFDTSILKRAQKEGKVTIRFINIREYGIGLHKLVDDKPYGGGVGMLLRVDVIDRAIQEARMGISSERVILLDPRGKKYHQELAEEFTHYEHLILLCGHYEGFDERVRSLVDEQISIGDYVLSGGEIPAMIITESVIRLLPDVLKKSEATQFESFSSIDNTRLLEHPQYTRPDIYKGMSVPSILLSGHAKNIEEFRKKEAVRVTKSARPDMLDTTDSDPTRK